MNLSSIESKSFLSADLDLKSLEGPTGSEKLDISREEQELRRLLVW